MATEDEPYKIMVFRPDKQEFAKFSKYIEHMEKMGAHRAGVAKVIPPKDWSPRVKDDYKRVDSITIPVPISQSVTGIDGVYQQYSKRRKPMSVKEFRQLAQSDSYETPVHSTSEELDSHYWDTIALGDRVYGADVSASLFDKRVKKWNLKSLNTILDRVSNDYGLKIEGVNTTYLYFGMWKTSFPWHTEDCDLYSINYLHFGKRKVWYAIPPSHGKRFERLIKSFYPANNQACEGFLRHKTTIISPAVLDEHSIPYNKVDQNEGEFIITFPYCYHAGYNAGFNCAEAINFASLRWIDYGKNATKCICRSQNISISMDTFVKTYQSDQYERWLLNGGNKDKHPEELDCRKSCSTGSTNQLKTHSSQGSCLAAGPKITLTFITKNGVTSVGSCTNYAKERLRKRRKLNSAAQSNISQECELVPTQENGANGSFEEDNSLKQTWLDNYILYYKARKFDIRIESIMEEWAKPLSSLWIHTPRDFNSETTYNKMCSLRIPHCSICSIINKLCDKELSSLLPPESISRIPACAFSSQKEIVWDWCTSSPLLTCSECQVCVHASCYKLSNLPNGDWLCQRCEDLEQSVECILCCLRGGAFKKTVDDSWVHVVCALLTEDVRFQSDGRVLLGQIKSQLHMCSFCYGLSGHSKDHVPGFSTVQCDEENCDETFHVTCAAAAGVHFKLPESPPFRILKICLKHKDAIDSSLQSAKDGMWSVGIGQIVIAKNRNRRFYYGTVIDIESKVLYKVDLEDGTSIENLQPHLVKREDCDGDSPPRLNEKIKFVGPNDEMTNGTYKGQISSLRFKVLFEDNSSVLVSRKDLFVEGQELSKRVQARLSTATPMRYNTEDDSSISFCPFKRI